MVCACQSKKSGGVPTFTVVLPDGESIAYSSDIAAEARAQQTPGAYVVPGNQPV